MTTVNFFTPVESMIPLVEDRMRGGGNGYHPDLHAALEHILTSGGKRVRPTVALLIGGMIGAEVQHLITLAAAVELLHTATLVHDDLIDGSLLRRGNPTLNSEWSPAATILTGDYIFAQAAKFAADTQSVEIMRLFAKTLSTVVDGEITQIFDRGIKPSKERYYKRIYSKTASMFELASSAPAYLVDDSPAQFENLRRYGYGIGMAFQIVDDILDFTSEEDTIGKPVGSDLQRGLVTLPTLLYAEKNPDDPVLMRALQKNGELNNEDAKKLVEIIRQSGAIEEALDEANQFVKRGSEAIVDYPKNQERKALEELASFVIHRIS